MSEPSRAMLVHLSHEATRPLGGVGVVLQRLLESPAYREAFPRTLLVNSLIMPCGQGSYEARESLERDLRAQGEVLYSGLRRHNPPRLEQLFRPVEARYDVSLVYGRRQVGHTTAEVLLVDLSDVLRNYRVFMGSMPGFLRRLRESLGVDISLECKGERPAAYRLVSRLWQRALGTRLGASRLVNGLYRLAVRRGLLRVPPLECDGLEGMVLAEPVFEAVRALRQAEGLPCVVLAQEHRSLPLAYKALLEGSEWCHTVYYAGEVRTAKTLVEYGDSPGQVASEQRFYQVLRQGLAQGLSLGEVFNVEPWLSFQILRHGHLCERVGAVGESVAQELRFMDRRYRERSLPVIPHGNRLIETSWEARLESRARVRRYLLERLGLDCRLIMTRIARDDVCKALARDVTVCSFLEELLPEGRRPAVLLMVTAWSPGAPSAVIRSLQARVAEHNGRGGALHIHLINQADWPRGLDFTREDLHRATDVALGQSMYESYGLAQLEPLSCGAICVLSGVSGARFAVGEEAHPNLVVADYVTGEGERPAGRTIAEWKALSEAELRRMEQVGAERVARQLAERLPREEQGHRELLETGRRLARRMEWEPLLRERLVPFLQSGLHGAEAPHEQRVA
jgi:hypothetical protein